MQPFLSIIATVFFAQASWGYPNYQEAYSSYSSAVKSSPLDFQTHMTPNLYHLATLVCGSIDYYKVLLPGAQFEDLNVFRDSVCSNVPQEALIDFSTYETCMKTTECLKTTHMYFGYGIDETQNVYKFFNLTDIPKRTIVENCISDPTCDFQDEARSDLDHWYDVIDRCDEIEEQADLQEALMNAVPSYGGPDYNNALLSCMSKTADPELKRTIVKTLQTGALCSEDMVNSIASIMFAMENSTAPEEVTFMLAQKLIACDVINGTLDIEDMLTQLAGSNSEEMRRRGALLWQVISMAQEKEEMLKRRARAAKGRKEGKRGPNKRDYKEVLEGPLKETYDAEADFFQRWSYSQYDALTESEISYDIIFVSGPEMRSPYTVQYNYFKSVNPPEEQQITVSVDSPVWLEPVRMFVMGQNWMDVMTWFIQEFKDGNPHLPTFSFATSIFIDQMDVNSPTIQQFLEVVQNATQFAMTSLMENIGEPFELKIEGIAGTRASVRINGQLLDDGLTLKVTVFNVEGDMSFFEVNLSTLRSYAFDNLGLDVSARASLYGGAQDYNMTLSFFPFWMTDSRMDKHRCELSLRVNDKNGPLVNFESCHRELAVIEDQQISAMSFYRLLEIPNVFKLNFTVDLGESGMPSFLVSPKQAQLYMELFNQPIFDASFITRVSSNMDFSGKDIPILVMISNATFSTFIRDDLGLNMVTNIFDDQSSQTSYTVTLGQPMAYLAYGEISVNSCSPETEQFFFNLLMSQRIEMPRRLCYKVDAYQALSNFDGRFEYDTETGARKWEYELNIERDGMSFPFRFRGQCKVAPNQVMRGHYTLSPFDIVINVTNSDQFDTVENGLSSDLQDKIVFYQNAKGFALLYPPQSMVAMMRNCSGFYITSFEDFPGDVSILHPDYTLENFGEHNVPILQVEKGDAYKLSYYDGQKFLNTIHHCSNCTYIERKYYNDDLQRLKVEWAGDKLEATFDRQRDTLYDIHRMMATLDLGNASLTLQCPGDVSYVATGGLCTGLSVSDNDQDPIYNAECIENCDFVAQVEVKPMLEFDTSFLDSDYDYGADYYY